MDSLTLAAGNRSAGRSALGQPLLRCLLLTFTVAAVAFELPNLLGITALSPLTIAIVLGMVCHNTVGIPAVFKPGVVFSFNAQFWLLWALAFSAVLLGASTGLTLYRRFSEANFPRLVLILLMVSGASVLAKALIGTSAPRLARCRE
jgi:uncharacterized membrane protein YadS